jgi:tetrahydromethanopterin S-methyltransferase subunit G
MTERRKPSKARGVIGPRNGQHRTAVLLEEIQSQMRVVLERVLDTPTKREFNERLDGIDKRLDGIDKRLDGIDKRLDGIEERVGGVEHELRGLRQEVARNAHGSELRAIEQRLTVLERHAGL